MLKYLFIVFIFFTTILTAAPYPYGLQTQEQAQALNKITKQLRCLVCENQSVYESESPFAESIRTKAANMLLEDQTTAQIMTYFKKQYGQYIDYSPQMAKSTLLLWMIPYILLFFIIGLFLWRYFSS